MKMNKKNPRRRRHIRQQNLTSDVTRDNTHLNATLRTVCDDNALLVAANRTALDENSTLSTALQMSEQTLLTRDRLHIQSVQDLHLDNIIERTNLIKQIESERARLVRKLAADRKRADEEESRLVSKVHALETLNAEMAERAAFQIQINTTISDRLDVDSRRLADALVASREIVEELECSRQETVTVREDLADLQRLHNEEEFRREMGLPPAYGGLEEVESAPWERHCIDAGRLDGGSCAENMHLMESIAEEHFGWRIRKAQARAGQLRQRKNPEIPNRAGAQLLIDASESLAETCASLAWGVGKIAEIDAKLTQESSQQPTSNPSFSSFPPPIKKRRLSASTTDLPATSPHDARPRKVLPKYSLQPAQIPPENPTSFAFLNHTLAHRAITKILSLHFHLISALSLRAYPINTLHPTHTLKLSRSFRMIEDFLRSLIETASKIPLQSRSPNGSCTGCDTLDCGGNCVRLGRLQGYATQIQVLMRELRGLYERGLKGVLRGVYVMVEDSVGCERRCAAVAGGLG